MGKIDKVKHVEDTFKTMRNALCNKIINLANYTLGNTELQRARRDKEAFFNMQIFTKQDKTNLQLT